ncbi:MAG: DoxX family protein [Candidatus Krumholzibacteria bacterium]|nr:DoxX family protein [Candidatus Krumholzibacteria bacterium]
MLGLLSGKAVNRNLGLLLLRVGIGLSLLAAHGYDKITGGPDLWAGVGANMKNLGIGFWPTLWGFMAAVSEFGASILLMLGVLFRPAAAMLAFTMFVAILTHMNMPADAPAAGLKGASHAFELFCVYIALILTGPGKYAFSLIRKSDLRDD